MCSYSLEVRGDRATLCKCLGIRGHVSLIPARTKLILRGRQLRDEMCSRHTEGTKEGEGKKGFCKGGHREALRAVQENLKQQKWILKWFWRTCLRAWSGSSLPLFLSNPGALRVASGAGARVVWMLQSPADQPQGLPTSTALGLLVTARLHLTCVSFRVLFKSLLRGTFSSHCSPPNWVRYTLW